MNKELTIFLLIIWIAFCLINLMEGIYQDIKENNIKPIVAGIFVWLFNC